MSYQVLARKWRPRLFREMVGQEHVLRALINALDHNRLHHAYLFTGTRGVGKTTIARILAKCLNCEVGVSSEPCDQCSACVEINEGRFVDLIEVDAASRTKVEDTRDLLENVQYSPTRGRYKVYLIDEVHMLSNSSFNALLKTLEEPPPHVKFLLATTDPQKLPVTVLSRCLQFSLKNMSPERIVGHLKTVLEKEMVPFEEAGLWQLGRAADGSMRDALSLTDQSIAYSNGKVTEADVRVMLGTIDQSLVHAVLSALVKEDGQAILNATSQMAEHAPDFSSVLGELISVLHRVAIAQVMPEAIDNSLGDRQQIFDLAQAIAPEDIQLFYQTALLGRRDLSLSPDPKSGFEMVILRMLTFKPQGLVDIPSKALPVSETQPTNSNPDVQDKQETEAQDTVKKSDHDLNQSLVGSIPDVENHYETPSLSTHNEKMGMPSTEQNDKKDYIDQGLKQEDLNQEDLDQGDSEQELTQQEYVDEGQVTALSKMVEKQDQDEPSIKTDALAKPLNIEPVNDDSDNDSSLAENTDASTITKLASKGIALSELNNQTWLRVYQDLRPGGLLQSTLVNSVISEREGNLIRFVLDEQQSTLYDVAHQQRLCDLLSDYFNETVSVEISLGVPSVETPAQIILRQQTLRQQEAEKAIINDPLVQHLQQTFGAEIVEDSIKPID